MYDVRIRGSVDVLFISETKIDESFPSAQFLIPDFIIHLPDNTANSDGISPTGDLKILNKMAQALSLCVLNYK